MELDKMSTHNPLFRVMVQNLPDTISNRKLRKRLYDSTRKLDYLMILDTYNYFSKNTTSLMIPLKYFLMTREELMSLYTEVAKAAPVSDVTAFLTDMTQKCNETYERGEERFWDLESDLTFFIVLANRFSALSSEEHTDLLKNFFEIKKKSIVKKRSLLKTLDKDLMYYFGENPDSFARLDVLKLQIIHTCLTSGDTDKMYAELLKTQCNDKQLLMSFIEYLQWCKCSNPWIIINTLFSDNAKIRCLLPEARKLVLEIIIATFDSIPEENLHHYIMEYIITATLRSPSKKLDDMIHDTVGDYMKFSTKELDRMKNIIRRVLNND